MRRLKSNEQQTELHINMNIVSIYQETQNLPSSYTSHCGYKILSSNTINYVIFQYYSGLITGILNPNPEFIFLVKN